MRIRDQFLLGMAVPLSLLVLQVVAVQYLLREHRVAVAFIASAQEIIEADFAAADAAKALRAEVKRLPSIYSIASDAAKPMTEIAARLEARLEAILSSPTLTNAQLASRAAIERDAVDLRRQLELTRSLLNQKGASLDELIERAIFTDRAAQVLEADLVALSVEMRARLQQAVDEEQRVRNRPAIAGLIIGAAATALLAAFAWLYVDRGIVRRLTALSASMGAVAHGNLRVELPPRTIDDEIGEMTDALTVFRNTAVEIEENNLREIAEANRRIIDSLRYARRIQSALLPSQELLAQHLEEHFLIWEPRDVVGGDFYWVHNDSRGLFLLIGDCTGHGVPGAFMTLIACGLVDRHLQRTEERSPSKILAAIHRDLRILLARNESGEGLEAGACFIEPSGRRMLFAGARFSLWEAHGAEVREHKGSRDGIGYGHVDPDIDYGDRMIALEPKTRLYLTTDGLIDQIGGPRRRSFGRRRFAAELADLAHAPFRDQGDRLRKNLAAYQGAEPRRDDVTVLGFLPWNVRG